MQENFDRETLSKPGIFINSAHHPREMTSISLTLYIMLKSLHSWVHRKEPPNLLAYLKKEEKLLSRIIQGEAALFFVPIVNIDGFAFINDYFQKTGRIPKKRKNMHKYSKKVCSTYFHPWKDNGVDLNRNYPFGWGIAGVKDLGPCHQNYPGPKPFSEPETAAVRDFLLKWKNMKFAMSFHSYGNYLCIPFNALGMRNKKLKEPQFKRARTFYRLLKKSETLP